MKILIALLLKILFMGSILFSKNIRSGNLENLLAQIKNILYPPFTDLAFEFSDLHIKNAILQVAEPITYGITTVPELVK